MHQVLNQNGILIRLDDLAQSYDDGFEQCKDIWRKNQDLSTEEQLRIMLELLPDEKPKTISPNLMQGLVDAFTNPLLDYPPPLINGAKETVKQIKEGKYKIGLVCNTGRTPGKTIRILLERVGLINYFYVTTFSNELGIRKPDPRIFLHTLSQMQSLPRNSLHVGDVVELDVLGAKNVGMLSVHLNPDHVPYQKITPDFAISHLTELEYVLMKLK